MIKVKYLEFSLYFGEVTFMAKWNFSKMRDEDGSSFYAKQFAGIWYSPLSDEHSMSFIRDFTTTTNINCYSQQIGMVQFSGLYWCPKYELCLISRVWSEGPGLFALELT